MREPAAPELPEVPPRRGRRRLVWIAIASAAIIVGALVAYVALQPGPPLRLLDVSYTPDPVAPDQTVTVTAHVQGGSFLAPLGVQVEYNSFFTNAASGGGSLFSRGGDTYSGTIGPFPNGTAVWFIVFVVGGQGFQLSDSYTLNVDDVPQGGKSGLQLNSVVLDPPQPTSLDLPVVTVNVTSTARLTDVSFSSMYFYSASGSTSSGGGNGAMQLNNRGNYTTLPLFGMHGSLGGGTTVGTVWVYRVSATDSVGDAVLSPAYRFTVASPEV